MSNPRLSVLLDRSCSKLPRIYLVELPNIARPLSNLAFGIEREHSTDFGGLLEAKSSAKTTKTGQKPDFRLFSGAVYKHVYKRSVYKPEIKNCL